MFQQEVRFCTQAAGQYADPSLCLAGAHEALAEAQARCQATGGCWPQTCCGGTCVATSSDANNCGGCGIVCPSGQSCVGGQCGCPSGQTLCGGACQPVGNAANCDGNCTACPSGQACVNGACTPQCADPCATYSAACGGCVPKTCPACQSCDPGSGECVAACDAAHCCSCGSGCAYCADLDTDVNNCGACGTVCDAVVRGAICSGGQCGCPSGTRACYYSCVAPTDIPCGECYDTGTCPSGQSCANVAGHICCTSAPVTNGSSPGPCGP